MRNAMFWICHGLIWLNLVFYLICTLLEIFACMPIQKIWHPWIEGRCLAIHTIDVNVITAAINAVSDFSILILPQWSIWNLHMSLKKKLGVSAIFLIGVLWVQEVISSYVAYEIISACVSSAVRLYYATKLLHSKDITYDISIMIHWAVLELVSGILAMCLPAFPKFFRNLKASRLGIVLRSLLRGKSEANLKLDIQPGQRNAVKGLVQSGFRKYRFLSNEFPTSKNGDSEQDRANEYSLGELSKNRILRNTQIVTSSDRDPASMAHSRNGDSEQDRANEYSLGELSANRILRTTQIVKTSDRDSASMAHRGNGANVWSNTHSFAADDAVLIFKGH